MKSDNRSDFEGHVAVVTGGAGDIGSSIVERLVKQGARVAVIDTEVEKAKSVAARLGGWTERMIFLEADATNILDVEKAIGTVIQTYNKIDILVNSVGYHQFASISKLSTDLWDMTINVCLDSVFVCTKVTVPYMIKRKYGRIINISSVAALQGSAGYSHYAAAKAGILGFTRSLALELAGFGITVNAVAPGPVKSQMLLGLLRVRNPRRELAKIPVGRFGEPRDIAHVVCFLAHPESEWITGVVIPVDGGKHLGYMKGG